MTRFRNNVDSALLWIMDIVCFDLPYSHGSTWSSLSLQVIAQRLASIAQLIKEKSGGDR